MAEVPLAGVSEGIVERAIHNRTSTAESRGSGLLLRVLLLLSEGYVESGEQEDAEEQLSHLRTSSVTLRVIFSLPRITFTGTVSPGL